MKRTDRISLARHLNALIKDEERGANIWLYCNNGLEVKEILKNTTVNRFAIINNNDEEDVDVETFADFDDDVEHRVVGVSYSREGYYNLMYLFNELSFYIDVVSGEFQYVFERGNGVEKFILKVFPK